MPEWLSLLYPLFIVTLAVAHFAQIPPPVKVMGSWGQILTAMTMLSPVKLLCRARIPSLPLKHLSLQQKIPLYLLHCGHSDLNLELGFRRLRALNLKGIGGEMK